MSATEQAQITGPAGVIDTVLDIPASPEGIALVTHPHPLFGGANTNKVAHTLARTLRDLGYATLRPNFRGVGKSSGEHDHGMGETEDMLAVLNWARERFPALAGRAPVLAGFSFGAFVQTRVAKRLEEAGTPARHLILVGTAAGHVEGLRQYSTEAVHKDAIVIHGANDETVPLANVLTWAEPLDIPVIVVPGSDHFFHGRLHFIRDILHRLLPRAGAQERS